MREIKFRVWDKTRKKLFQVVSIDFILERVEVWVSTIATFLSFNEIELMQYTGLKDKNGVEIYEGDIVEDDILGISLYLIKFVKGRFTMVDSEDETGYLWILSEECKVVGNIHDNPELLEIAK